MPVVAALAIGALAAGCGNGDDVCTTTSALSSDGGSLDGTVAEGGGDATAGDSQAGDATASQNPDANGTPATTAAVRLANWSADAPAVDFCLAPHGTGAFQGPMLASLAAAIDEGGVVDAGAAALPFPQASAYVPVSPQQYDARLVAAGSTSCAAGVAADATNLPVLDAGAFATLALMGDLGGVDGAPGGLILAGFLDALSASKVGVRFINAADGSTPVNFGIGETAATFSPIFSDVAFGQAGTISGGGSDAAATTAETYAENDFGGSGMATFDVLDAANTTDLEVTAPSVTIAAGAVTTFVFVGPVFDPEAGAPVDELLMCVDNAGTIGVLGACRVVSN
jgi:hypothetical protein